MKECNSKDFFEKHPELKQSIILIQEKKRLIEEWDDKEVNSWLPAEEFSKMNLRPSPFTNRSALLIALMTVTVVPMFILGVPIALMFHRRNKKIEHIRNIQHELNSTLPTCYKPQRDHVSLEQEKYLKALVEEGLVF